MVILSKPTVHVANYDEDARKYPVGMREMSIGNNNAAELSREKRGEIVEEVIKKYKELIPASYKRLLRRIGRSLDRAIRENHRLLIVISGEKNELVALLAARLIQYYEKKYRRRVGKEEIKTLYVFHDEFEDAKLRKDVVKRFVKEKTNMISLTIARYEESERFLGTTFTVLVLDLVNDLKPNDVGRLVGIVKGGGIIIFQVPPWDKWDNVITIFKKNLIVPGYKEPRHIFISWFKRKLLKGNGIFIYDVDNEEIIKAEYNPPAGEHPKERELSIPSETVFSKKIYHLALTQDQVNVIKIIEDVFVSKRIKEKKKVVLITANRGRGKSCAIGISVAGLIDYYTRVKGRRKYRVIVTAPSSSNVQSFYELLVKALEELGIDYKRKRRHGNIVEVYGERFSVEYWPPLNVIFKKPDLVVVDEAAGIPVPMLHKIWKNNQRIIFATTIHGYEGVGRGFTVRFLPALKRDPSTFIETYEMKEPIRYAENDPIERWLFDALLLDAEPAELDEKDLEDIEKGRLEYLKLDPYELFSENGEEILRQLFGIYVLAHYRNEPDDLGILADAPHHLIRAVQTSSGKIVCAIQIAREGGLDDETVEDLLKGGKIPGNIIPDRLLKHLRIRVFGKSIGWRIVRIATHPKVQGRGIGSFALRMIKEEASKENLDWVGSGFGVNLQLLRFWQRNGFTVLHISPDRNPVSGEYTILVMNPISVPLQESVRIAGKEFKRKLLESLHDNYSDLETDIAIAMLKTPIPIFEDYCPLLTPVQIDRLWIYSYGPMTYEAVCDAMHEIARFYWYRYPKLKGFNLSKNEEYILTAKVLQAKSWEEVAEELGARPHAVMMLMKDIARKFINHFYNLTDKSPVGLSLEESGKREFNDLLNACKKRFYSRRASLEEKK